VLITIDPVEPEGWLIARAADILRRGGVAVVPTDTVYGLACTISSQKSIQRIYKLKDLDPKKPLAILVADIATVSLYARGISTPTYRMMKRVLPGPYTFILEGSKLVPKIMLTKRKTAGIRVPDNPICIALVRELGNPIITTSATLPDGQVLHDTSLIHDHFGKRIDLVIDGSIVPGMPSSVISLINDSPEIIRRGVGDVAIFE
jgi:tRNA threonylcarbamoyl adenosine modification protein (Sua5/YciO/YrdC/YwlC family)